ncbi:MAG: hypothetical protein AAGA48_37125 [Myxococcota bacterium]
MQADWTIHSVATGLCLLFVGACAGPLPDGNPTTTPDAVVDETGPRFAIATSVFSTQSYEFIGYVGFAESLERGEVLLSEALELPGGGQVWGVPGSGVIFVTEHETQSVGKFGFVDGELTELGRVGLSGVGVTVLLEEQLVFDGPDHGYLFDLISGQIVELDLEAMEIRSTTDIGDLLDADLSTFIYTFQERADGRLTTATYAVDLAEDLVSDTSWILVFDPATGTLDRVAAPCGGLTFAAESASGDWFYLSNPFVAGVHLLDSSRAPEPCMVRMPAGSDQPDSQTLALNELTGAPSGGMVPIGDGQVYVRSLDTETYPIADTTTGLELYTIPAWRTWRVDLDNPTSAVLLDVPPRIGGVFFHTDGESFYENDTVADLSSSTLVKATTDGDGPPGLVVPGAPFTLAEMYKP